MKDERWDLGNTTLFTKSKRQVVHCIKQCIVNHEIQYSLRKFRNPILYISTIWAKDKEGSWWLSSLELAIISKAS